MSDLVQVAVARTRLPFVTPAGDTVSISNGVLYVNARRRTAVEALDLSAALARAVIELAEQRIHHATPISQEASHA